MGNVGRFLVLRSELNLTDEQRGQIRDVLAANRSRIVGVTKSVREKRVALRDAVLASDLDEARIRAAADELGQAAGDAAVKAAQLRGQLAPILNEEQHRLIGDFIAEQDKAMAAFLEQAGGGQ
jgi:Spy/CpxP family protein refolding chaperone